MLNLLFYELKFYFKNKIELIELIGFIAIVNLTLSFALPSTLTVNNELVVAGFWLAIVAGSSLGAGRLWQRDGVNGVLELYQLLPTSLELTILAKWLAFYLVTALALMAGALLIKLLGADLNLPVLMLAVLAGSFSISLIQMLAAAMLVRAGAGAAFLGLLALPLVSPSVIFGAAYCRQAELWDTSLLFLILYGLFLLPAVTLATASTLRASH